MDTFKKHNAYHIVFFAIIGAFYWINGLQFIGPAYLSDEIGYLTKAAVLAGHLVDLPSQWHAGYPIIIAPLFSFFQDPFSLWKGILFVNAVMWSLNFYIINLILRKLFPKESTFSVFIAIVIIALYPSFISMSGYAFSTTAFSLIFTISAYLFINLNENKLNVFLLALVVGYLYWIHPIGICAVIASIGLLFRYKEIGYRCLFIYFVLMLFMVFFYKLVVHPWFITVMVTETAQVTKSYGSSNIIQNLLSISLWKSSALMVLGHLSYGLIATFGVMAFGIKYAIDNLRNHSLTSTYIYLAVCPILVILLGAIFFADSAMEERNGFPFGPHYWIYGRYLEMVLLPIIAIGFLALKSTKFLTVVACIFLILLSGYLLDFIETSNRYTLVNVQSFWPFLFNGKNDHFLEQFFIGACGVLILYLLARVNSKLPLLLIVPIYILSINSHSDFHNQILSGRSNPSSYVEIIKDSFPPRTCIGIDLYKPHKVRGVAKERELLYSYYFFNYNFEKMTPKQWFESCDGPLLTLNPAILNDKEDVVYVARELISGYFLVVKREHLDKIKYEKKISDVVIDTSAKNSCIINNCFSLSARKLRRYSKVGTLKNGRLVSTGKKGTLIFGPYKPISAGEYNLRLDAEVKTNNCIKLDVIYSKGRKTTSTELVCPGKKVHHFTFNQSKQVSDLEIRMRVASHDEVVIDGYQLTSKNGDLIN
jgi:hypothetical protein